jgi:site-specific recombinase XerD
VIKQCWKLGLITADERDRACDIESDTGERVLAGRSIRADEMGALLRACLADENTPLGIRDAALLTLLYRTGVRREEAATLLIERYDPAEQTLKVIGKHDKERLAYIAASAAPAFERWLAVVGSRHGPAFRPVDRWGNIAPRFMSTRAIARMVSQRQATANLPPLSTHDFRRTFIGDFIDAGGDLVQAQQLAGHASATTTAAYDRRPGRALRAAVNRLEMPSPEGTDL